jgi:hypothetical protein
LHNHRKHGIVAVGTVLINAAIISIRRSGMSGNDWSGTYLREVVHTIPIDTDDKTITIYSLSGRIAWAFADTQDKSRLAAFLSDQGVGCFHGYRPGLGWYILNVRIKGSLIEIHAECADPFEPSYETCTPWEIDLLMEGKRVRVVTLTEWAAHTVASLPFEDLHAIVSGTVGKDASLTIQYHYGTDEWLLMCSGFSEKDTFHGILISGTHRPR